MNRHLRDPRTWLPAVVGALALWPRAIPPQPAGAPAEGRAVALPTLPKPRRDDKDRTWKLAAEHSTVRFLVDDGDDELLVGCPTVAGSLRRDGAGGGELELTIDLATATTIAGTDALDLHRVLGVRRADVVQYRGQLVSAASTDLPGVERLLFLGQLSFGSCVRQQPMMLWYCAIPGRPPRLQGHGPVRTAEYGLPQRLHLGLFDDGLTAVLGLDLEWRLDAR